MGKVKFVDILNNANVLTKHTSSITSFRGLVMSGLIAGAAVGACTSITAVIRENVKDPVKTIIEETGSCAILFGVAGGALAGGVAILSKMGANPITSLAMTCAIGAYSYNLLKDDQQQQIEDKKFCKSLNR